MIKKRNLDLSLVNYIDNLGMGIEARGALGGTVYYVEGNAGNDAWDGLSIDKPFQTLAKALAVSHANIAQRSRWAKRNTIYAFGDSFDEDLTALAQKTDLVGLGSCDHNHFARLIGNHSIGTTSYMGFRALNMGFKGESTGGDIFTIPTEQSGIAFRRCDFDGNTTTACTGGIIATGVESLSIEECNFRGPFSDAVIELGAGEANSLMIRGNTIHGANMGIDVSASLATSLRAGWIIGNFIKSTLACINDASSKLHVVDNRGITLANAGTAGAGAVVCNQFLSSGNQFTCANLCFMYPLAFDADGTA